ncbi:FtsX-like permease family protein [Streptomyces sp. NPDC102406]|uniref:FtsX-like permease family protein n=1 Tax=Streptomyces sp. NPDC102406 TaxID=3366171 RepID=UPI00380AF7B8
MHGGERECGAAGVWGFVLLRARAHRLLLTAAVLAVLLTTSVLAMLSAFSAAIGDASLRHALRTRDEATTALVVRADVPAEGRAAAVAAFDQGARRTFDGLPVHRASLITSGPYGLPHAPRGRQPDLTRFAAIERSEVRITAGRLPRASRGPVIEAALPVVAARQLRLAPGDRLTLADRFGGPAVTVELTGVYRPARPSSPYWTLDELGGRGVRKLSFTTYGPLLTDPSVLSGGKVSDGPSAWLATADFRTMTTGRIGALRDAARTGPRDLLRSKALAGTTAAGTSLPDVLDRAERALLVARSTLLVVALQLVLLAGYALLLVARLLSAERAGETWTLRARGGSRARVAGLAAAEALLLALPAALCAPLLAGPLTRLVASQGALSRIGLRLSGDGVVAGGRVWLVGAAVAAGCALAVAVPALTSQAPERGRARALPAPLRAGADVGLLVVAGVAYWQLDRRAEGAGALGADRGGGLGIDPVLVVAPALALLAGTVLTLRLLPPAARLAERWAAGGRGLSAALAGWQFSRRPARGAGPVLLLVLAIAMGMLAVGQGASWDRSQEDQADFRSGAPVRVLATEPGMDQAARYARVPGVREAAPGYRQPIPLGDGRTATLLALDTGHLPDDLLLRDDLTDSSPRRLVAAITPRRATDPGIRLPATTARARFALRATNLDGTGSLGPGESTTVSVTLQDRYGLTYRLGIGDLPLDGRVHRLGPDLDRGAGPFTVTGLAFDTDERVGAGARHRIVLEGVSGVDRGGRVREADRAGARWSTSMVGRGAPSAHAEGAPTAPKLAPSRADGTLAVEYGTGFVPPELSTGGAAPGVTVRLDIERPEVTEIAAVATDRYLASTGTRTGQSVDVELNGANVRVRIVDSVRALPTTGPEAAAATGRGGAQDGGALLLDLRDLNRVLAAADTGDELRGGIADPVAPNEWWLSTAPGGDTEAAAALRALPDLDPSQVVVRAETGDRLRDDPLGAGPQSALTAAALAAALLAAVGFAVNTAGSLRERGAEFAILGALGASRRGLARMVAAEQGILVGLALLVGAGLGTFLTRAVVPLIVLTGDATRPVPDVLVHLPARQVALLLAGVALTPAVITLGLALRRPPRAAITLRDQGGE